MSSSRLIGLLGIPAVVVSFFLFAAASQKPPKPLTEHPRYKKWPITDSEKPEPSDPEAKKIRKARGDRFGLRDRARDPRRFAITEERESVFGSPPTHAPIQPALPVAESSAIVIADIKSAEAFLSTDQTAIYSEFSLAVRELIHSSSPEIGAGSLVTAVRGGGGVRFPSGKIVLRGHDAAPLPNVESRYVFFLKGVNSNQYFDIVTAYEIRNGKVFPLDGGGPDGYQFPEYAGHRRFTGMDETAFLYFVREALQASADTPEGVR
ncbi:MAG: hypothetical protein ACRD5F_04145 [Candidatus Acidiferrales bacterium]